MLFFRSRTAMPNVLIDDTVMHYTSKIVYTVMALSQRKSGLVKLTVAELVGKTGLCEATVLQALAELEAGGFIKKKRNWRFSYGIGSAVFSSNTYKLRLDFSNGYTLISSAILDMDLTPAAFCVLLFLYRCAGRTGRAFPSIRYIAGAWKEKTGKGLYMAKATVLRALKSLAKLQAVCKCYCKTKEGDFGNNSYFMTDMVLAYTSARSAHNSDTGANSLAASAVSGGGIIFWEASHSNKITGVYMKRRND